MAESGSELFVKAIYENTKRPETDEEHVPRLSTDRCRRCEFHAVESFEGHRRHYCVFWDGWLTEIKWCNK